MENIDQPHNIKETIQHLDSNMLQQMIFIYNALENGWQIKKKDNNIYSFKKPHKNKTEYFSDTYLSTFIKDNISLKNLFLGICNEIK